jgi:F420-dependent oxidoreductase-like protein
MKPWFSFHLPNFTHPDAQPEQLFDRVVEQAQAAEQAGFRQVTVMDHLYQIGGVGQLDDPMLEGWSVLNALARETKSVRLGTQVSGVTYRNPAMLAKMATSLDVISGGRAMLGLGAAWNDVEHAGYGFEFPPVKERMDRLDEALTIVRLMFDEDRPSFAGEHYQVNEVLNFPRPIQPGGPPIMVGGVGEQRTLRIAAKHADMTHWFALSMDELRHKKELLARYCDDIGRDVGEIELVLGAPVVLAVTAAEKETQLQRIPAERRANMTVGSADECAAALRRYIDEGFTGFTFNNTLYSTPEQIGAVGEILKQLDS